MADDGPKTKAIVPLKASDALRTANTYDADWKRWQELIKSGALPRHVDTPEKAITLARAGEIYGWDPIRSLRSLFMVEGRVEMWAQDMLGLIMEKCPAAQVQPVVMSSNRVVIKARRPPQFPDWVEFETRSEQFQHLIDDKRRKPWQNYCGDMLWARCVSRIGRRMFPDVTAGAYTAGEVSEAEFTIRQERPRRGGSVRVEAPDLTPEPQAPTAEEAVVVSEVDYGDCELCGGRDGEHDDPLCPEAGVAEVYGE